MFIRICSDSEVYQSKWDSYSAQCWRALIWGAKRQISCSGMNPELIAHFRIQWKEQAKRNVNCKCNFDNDFYSYRHMRKNHIFHSVFWYHPVKKGFTYNDYLRHGMCTFAKVISSNNFNIKQFHRWDREYHRVKPFPLDIFYSKGAQHLATT